MGRERERERERETERGEKEIVMRREERTGREMRVHEAILCVRVRKDEKEE